MAAAVAVAVSVYVALAVAMYVAVAVFASLALQTAFGTVFFCHILYRFTNRQANVI